MASGAASPVALQLHPLQINPDTKEVFLRLPAPHENIIITPPRLDDAHMVVEYLNDPRIYTKLENPPYPYLPEHAEWWLNLVKKESDSLLKDLHDAGDNNQAPIFSKGCPVRSLREIKEDGSDLFIGDIGIDRAKRFSYLRDTESEAQKDKHNMSLPAGDPEIIWDIGDYLAPSHHGKGIMSAALGTLLREWAIPRMNANTVHGIAFKDNVASVRVFEKNGFKMFDTVEDCVELSPSKGGGIAGLHFLEWRLEH